MTGYSEHGSSGLSREARRIWDAPPVAVTVPGAEVAAVRDLPVGYILDLVPERPRAPRCPACQYRRDAPGHKRTCGDPVPMAQVLDAIRERRVG